MEEKVIRLAKQLYTMAKFSPDIKRCIEIAMYEIVGNKTLTEIYLLNDICKNDYIEYILKIMKNS